jgi:hypothetical protein
MSCPPVQACVDGTCQALPRVEEGACATNFTEGATCRGSSFGNRICNDVDGDGQGLCADAPAVGEPCPSWRCERGAQCTYNEDDDEMVCVAEGVAGERCDEVCCAVGLMCENSVCVTRAASVEGIGDYCFEE